MIAIGKVTNKEIQVFQAFQVTGMSSAPKLLYSNDDADSKVYIEDNSSVFKYFSSGIIENLSGI